MKAVLDSSVIIALSKTGHLRLLKNLFQEIIIPKAVYVEICVKGKGLKGDRELAKAKSRGEVTVKEPKDRKMVAALIDPLGKGEAEAITLAIEEKADTLIIDDRLARRKATSMGIPIGGTLKVLRTMYDRKLYSLNEFIETVQTLKNLGFYISDDVIKRVSNLNE